MEPRQTSHEIVGYPASDIEKSVGLGGRRLRLLGYNEIRFFYYFEKQNFQLLNALHSTFSRRQHHLENSFKAIAISSLHLLKSIREWIFYCGPFD